MLPWCGTAGLSVFRGEEGPGAGDFRINLDHLRAGYFQRDLDYQITISSTRSAWHSFSRHVRKSFSFSFFEKKLFFKKKIDDPKLQPAVKATACKCYRENKSGKQFLLQRM